LPVFLSGGLFAEYANECSLVIVKWLYNLQTKHSKKALFKMDKILNPQLLIKLSLSLTALYGAIVVGMSAAISHVFLAQFSGKTLTSPGKLLPLVIIGWHLGLWMFVYTVWAGLFALPLHFGKLAPLGGQLLLISWLLLAVIAWIRK
jgi:uncharacterized transporter YbjL